MYVCVGERERERERELLSMCIYLQSVFSYACVPPNRGLQGGESVRLRLEYVLLHIECVLLHIECVLLHIECVLLHIECVLLVAFKEALKSSYKQ